MSVKTMFFGLILCFQIMMPRSLLRGISLCSGSCIFIIYRTSVVVNYNRQEISRQNKTE